MIKCCIDKCTTNKFDQNNQNIRLYNIKNIFKMFEFYHTCHKLDCLEFQKILLFFNNIVWENISFREQLEYEACLYRINAYYFTN